MGLLFGNKNNIKYWDKKAKQYKDKPEATINDVYFRLVEIEAMNLWIKDSDKVLDVGCGNGWGSKQLKGKVLGIDLSKEMITQAGKGFEVGDIMDLSKYYGKYDVVVCNRVLINLPSEKDQIHALVELKKCYKKYLIITEVTKQGRNNINELRKIFGLKPIKKHWHNLYVDEKIMKGWEKRECYPIYQTISKVIYPYALKQTGDPEFLNEVNEIAWKIQGLNGRYLLAGHQVTFLYD